VPTGLFVTRDHFYYFPRKCPESIPDLPHRPALLSPDELKAGFTPEFIRARFRLTDMEQAREGQNYSGSVSCEQERQE
jgi:hypothetical protein